MAEGNYDSPAATLAERVEWFSPQLTFTFDQDRVPFHNIRGAIELRTLFSAHPGDIVLLFRGNRLGPSDTRPRFEPEILNGTPPSSVLVFHKAFTRNGAVVTWTILAGGEEGVIDVIAGALGSLAPAVTYYNGDNVEDLSLDTRHAMSEVVIPREATVIYHLNSDNFLPFVFCKTVPVHIRCMSVFYTVFPVLREWARDKFLVLPYKSAGAQVGFENIRFNALNPQQKILHMYLALGFSLLGPAFSVTANLPAQVQRRLSAAAASSNRDIVFGGTCAEFANIAGWTPISAGAPMLGMIGRAVALDKAGEYRPSIRRVDLGTGADLAALGLISPTVIDIYEQMRLVFQRYHSTSICLAAESISSCAHLFSAAYPLIHADIQALMACRDEIVHAHYLALTDNQEERFKVATMPRAVYAGLLMYTAHLTEDEKTLFKDFKMSAIKEHIPSSQERDVIELSIKGIPSSRDLILLSILNNLQIEDARSRFNLLSLEERPRVAAALMRLPELGPLGRELTAEVLDKQAADQVKMTMTLLSEHAERRARQMQADARELATEAEQDAASAKARKWIAKVRDYIDSSVDAKSFIPMAASDAGRAVHAAISRAYGTFIGAVSQGLSIEDIQTAHTTIGAVQVRMPEDQFLGRLMAGLNMGAPAPRNEPAQDPAVQA